MESYIHLYKTNSEFTEAYNSPNYKEPWLSLTEGNMEVNYNKPKLTAITFDNITWVTDVPATGGTATKDNCTFEVYAKYDNGISVDISSDAIVTGELIVAETTATTRQSAGTLTLTASYGDFTATGNVTVYQEAAVPDFSMEPLTFNILSAGTVNWTASDSSLTKTIEYKLNDSNNWASITSNTGESAPTITVKAGDKIQFRGNNAAYSNEEALDNTFSGSTAEFEVEGNIMSLINSTNFTTATTLESNFTFAGLFGDCTGLTSAENLILPATTLAIGCYFTMFDGCTSLTTAPKLPATTLAEGCYVSMFQGCSSLTSAPELPATTLTEACYISMFNGCTSLTTAPALPATTLADSCYANMFGSCTLLNYIKCLATDISATNCTQGWVSGVASTGTFIKSPDMSRWIESSDGIPTGWIVSDNKEPLTFKISSPGTINWAATDSSASKTIEYKLNNEEWTSITSNMEGVKITVNAGDKIQFRGNNATYGTSSSYYSTFSGSTAGFEIEGSIMSLINSTRFVTATTLDSAYTFSYLFNGCTGLTSAKNLILPATTLAQYCYSHMFNGCTSLTTAPALPATTLASNCYVGMFQGCTSLNYIKCLATDISATNCTLDWVDGVASTGTFVKAADMTGWATGSNGIPTGWAVKKYIDYNKEPLTFKISSPGTINWTASNRGLTKTIDYKLNDGEWTSITSNTGSSAPTITVKAGDKIQFRGNNAAYSTSSSYYSAFSGSTAGFEIEGNIMSLINPTDFSILTTLESNFTFNNLFKGCTGLTSTKNLILPATTLTQYCYSGMFYGCTSLTTAPSLPAKTLTSQCYQSMFQGCTSLTTAPALPATNLADNCYEYMFYGCTSLTTAPALPATTLADYCYDGMFFDCTSLTTAPELPANTLVDSCYSSMFQNCSSLATAPALPAMTLASSCYADMFNSCASLSTAPALPATILAYGCYHSMFYGCTSLTTAPKELPATTLADYCYYYMFYGCTSLATVPSNLLPATTLANNCYSMMFYGCSSLTSAPELPANTLVDGCYSTMFKGCTSLTTAPELPATTLADYCYSYMFNGCTKLNYIKCLAIDISASYCTNTWVDGVASNGTFVKASSMTSWKTGTSGIPSGWTVQDAS